MTEITVSRLVVPKSIGDSDADDFIASCEVINRVIAGVIGSNDFAVEPVERLPRAHDPEWNLVAYIAKVGGRVVARAGYGSQLRGDPKECWIDIYVDEEFRGAGIGGALFERLQATAAANGKSALYSRVLTTYDPDGEQVASANGAGSVSARDAGAAFALARGFVLEQVGYINRLALPVSPELLDERGAVAEAGFGDDYELLSWSGRTPEEYLAAMGALLTAMSTEEPHADLEVTEDVWDAERVRATEDREAASPRVKLTAAARHRATGELVAFTTLDVPPEVERPVNQDATLVLPAHRGKRLGLAVKIENLRQLQATFPGHPSVTTINAVENDYMITVNRSVGFVAVGQGGIFSRSVEGA